ncbi:MAG: NnrS family protein [Nitrosomonadales bacterium]|nr:MAG: NnrS family protein [Nitrosomonadales bacterium]
MKTLPRTWHTFTAAPHRMMMLGGAAQGVLTLLWWLFDLLGRYGGLYAAPAWSIAPVWAHAFLMLYGFFPFFIFGFLMTTYPNWMNGEKIPPRFYVPSFLLLASGIALFYLGLVAGKALLLAGATLLLAGWGIALHALLRVLVRTPHPDKIHPTITTIALIMGWFGMAAYLAWLATDSAWALNFSRHAGIWWFMLPILLAVCHKMIPFFSSRVLENYTMVRPYWALYFMLACAVLHGSLELAQQAQLLWLADFPLLAFTLYFSYTWGLLRSFSVKLLAVLHVGFAWLSVAMLLYGVQSLTLFATGSAPFGLAPLHALTIGFFASMILAMASRVTLGHSGRELVADAATWALFLGFQFTAMARITPDLSGLPASLFYPLAAGIWLACYGAWFAKYGPVYWRPRIDHRPG